VGLDLIDVHVCEGVCVCVCVCVYVCVVCVCCVCFVCVLVLGVRLINEYYCCNYHDYYYYCYC